MFAAIAAQVSVTQGQPAVPIAIPRDWAALPPLDYRDQPASVIEYARYVEGESRAGRCLAAVQQGQRWSLRVEFVVLASTDGQVRQVVPRAINCPTVEQYASGLVSRMARNNIDTHGAEREGWYRTSLTFTWAG